MHVSLYCGTLARALLKGRWDATELEKRMIAYQHQIALWSDQPGRFLKERQQFWEVVIGQPHTYQIVDVGTQGSLAEIGEPELTVDAFGARLLEHRLGQIHPIEQADPVLFEPGPGAARPTSDICYGLDMVPGYRLDALQKWIVYRTSRLHLIVGGGQGCVAFLDRKGGVVLLIKHRCFHD